MATLEKIRSKSTLLLVVVGLALIVFIVGDLVSSGSTYFNQMRENVAVINGDNIKARDYDEKVKQFTDVVKLQYGNNINDEMTEQIQQMVWESTIAEKIIGDECEEIGIIITDEELIDMITGNNISPMLLSNQMFYNENGQFDVNILKQFVNAINNEEAAQNIPYEQLQLYRNFWQYTENAIKTIRLQEKYSNLLSASLVVNPLEAKYAYNNSKTSADVVYAKKDYFTIADSTVNVTDAEIKALYDKKKEQFKQEKSADIKYIAVDIKPSADDYSEIEKWINNLKEEFSTTDDIASLVNSYSDVQYRGINLTKDQIDADFQEFAFLGQPGDVTEPIFVNNTYKMARIIENGIESVDSVNLSNMFLQRETAEATQALVDSIMNAISLGADFSELAKEHSLLQNAANGGEIGWISEIDVEKKYAIPAFSTQEKDTFSIKEGNGINLFYVNKRGQEVTKAKIAILSREVEASDRTRTELFNKMKQFVANNNSIEKIDANAVANGYAVMSVKDLYTSATTINEIRKAREIVRWVFNNEEGAISDIFELEDKIVTAAISKHYEKGYRSEENVKHILTSEIRKEKKGDILVAQMKNKTIEQLATEGFRIDTINSVSFSSSYAGSIGNEPLLFARVASSEINKESAPIKGNTGAFIFKVISKEDSNKEYNEKEETVMLKVREEQFNMELMMRALKEAAEVEDTRYLFY